MLRIGYMASDFHPKLLVLAAQSELASFADLLRDFSIKCMAINLVKDGGIHSAETEVLLCEVNSENAEGLVVTDTASGKTNLTWHLSRDRAADFALKVESLVHSNDRAGSVILEIGRRDEVKVVVSFGEWDDEFLTA